MKKFLSVFLVLAMFAAMIPIVSVTVAAEDTTPTDTWTSNASYYDLSWCKTLDAADSNKTVTVDGKHYHVKGDVTSQTYHFTTAAQLAGLAYLSNATSGDLFKNDTFYIDADIDLGAHLWVPISKTSKFRGSLIGNVDGGSATISNMIIDTSNETSNVSAGLVGQFGGGWIKNLNLVGAKITAKKFTVGSFVGWQNGNVGSWQDENQGGYQNLTSDAQIVVNSGNSGDQFDDVGGIIGIINACNANNPGAIINNCVFTGTISAPHGDNVGGILGLSQHSGYGVQISDCVVISEKIEWGKNNLYITKNNADWNVGLGGIAGNLYSNDANDVTAYTVKNCYVAANLITLDSEVPERPTKNVGGITGASCSQYKTYENCQFDGIIVGNAGGIGGILGRYLTPATIKNSVVSGLAIRKEGTLSAFVGGGKNDGLSVTDCYGSAKMLDGAGGTAVTQIASDTDLSALLALKDTDGKNVWTREDGKLYPVLAIAKTHLGETTLSVAGSGADLGFYDFGDTMTVSTKAQLDGAAAIFRALPKENGEKFADKLSITLTIDRELLNGYEPEVQRLILLASGVDLDADDSRICVEFSQIAVEKNVNKEKPQFDGTYNVRIVAKMTDTGFKGVQFDYVVTQDGAKKIEFESAVIKTCYRSLIEVVDGQERVIEAEDGYFVVFVISNVRFDGVGTTQLSIRAKGVTDNPDGVVKSSLTTITLTPPAN